TSPASNSPASHARSLAGATSGRVARACDSDCEPGKGKMVIHGVIGRAAVWLGLAVASRTACETSTWGPDPGSDGRRNRLVAIPPLGYRAAVLDRSLARVLACSDSGAGTVKDVLSADGLFSIVHARRAHRQHSQPVTPTNSRTISRSDSNEEASPRGVS